jgi:plasmid maintenance system antidote protein VapI
MAVIAIHPGEHLAEELRESAEFWLNSQSLYEIRVARRKLGSRIRALPTLKRAEHSPA